MRAKKILVSIVALLVIGGILVLAWPTPKEPEYQGRKLANWVQVLGVLCEPQPKYANAIQAIGTNGIPFYLEWMAYKPNTFDEAKLYLVDKLFSSKNSWRNYKIRAIGAGVALQILGKDAEPAIPKLLEYATNSANPALQTKAILCLSANSDSATPVLLSLMMNTNQSVELRLCAGLYCSKRGSNAIVAAELERLLHLNEQVRQPALTASRSMAAPPAESQTPTP